MACALLGGLVAPHAGAGAAGAAPPSSSVSSGWVRPVDGRVVRAFQASACRWCAGHRGADLSARPGAKVRAAGGGTVVFAGSVAGALHVTVAHPGTLRTSYSFLRSISVRRGDMVERGDALGLVGGSGPGHPQGVLHFGLRVGDRYIDPMSLFAPADLTRLVRLVPVDVTRRPGLDRPALEGRALADALHVPAASDVRAASAAWVAKAEDDCTADTPAADGTGGSGHAMLAVGGIGSRSTGDGNPTFALDAAALGYEPSEVSWYSYSLDGRSYTRAHTWRSLRRQARNLRDQLRALQRDSPGREVDLIAHSQGGVVVDVFLQRVYDPGDPSLPPLGTVVTLASPHEGAPLATAVDDVRATVEGRVLTDTFGALSGDSLAPADSPAVRQLSEHSSLMRRLWDRRLPDHIDFTSFGGVDDVVVPADHTDVPGARQVTVDPSGFQDHTEIVRDASALSAVRLALEGKPPPCISAVQEVRNAVEPVVVSAAERSVGLVARALLATPERMTGWIR